MAFKITKDEDSRLIAIRNRLEDARDILDDHVAKANAAIAAIFSELNLEIEEYNEIVQEARGVVEDIASEMEGEYDEKSDNWRDGERGDATNTWIEALKDFEYDATDITAPSFEAIDFSNDPDHADLIDSLPRQPEY